ncbi:MAG TPA: hypothetical protein VF349_04595 [Candidatus Limnocylindrales bacterium]
MNRLPRRALALFAGLVVVASACASSSATFPAGVAPMGGSGGPGGSAGPGGGTNAVVNPGDPNSIISAVIAGGPDTKSFHLKIELNGTIKASGLSGLGGDASSGLTGDLKLDGSNIEGDVDLANQAAHLAATISLGSAGSTATIPADVILKDSALYYKIDLPGLSSGKYTKSSVGDLSSSLTGGAVSVPTVGPSGLAGVEDQVAQIRKALDDAGAKATLVGVEKVGGQDAYHITISVPLDLINSKIAGAAASAESTAAAGLTIDSAAVDVWVYKSGNRLAKIEIKAASATIGNLDVIVTVTDYDKPVTITAPPASQVETTAP